MTDKIVTKALDANAFTTSSTGAGYVNPEVWQKAVMEHEKANLVVAQLGRKINDLKGAPGDSFHVNIQQEITAEALTEGTAATVQAINYRQVTYTPSEYGVMVQITHKEKIRSINDLFQEKTKAMGYALAKKKDSVAIAALIAGASSTVTANGTAVASMTSADTMDNEDIANARTEMRKLDHNPKYLIIAPEHEGSLLKDSNFIDASVYGGREPVLTGEIGKYLGMKVLVTTQIPANSTNTSCKDALLLDENVFGILQKEDVRIESFYDIDLRAYKLQAVEDYDVQVEYPDGVCVLTAWAG